MGRPKQLIEVGGAPMLVGAVRAALASRCRPVVVVTGAHAAEVEALLDGLDVIATRNPDWTQGIGTSIRTGVRTVAATPADALVLALADQPLVDATTYDGLVDLHRRTGCPAVASEYAGTLGVPALFSRALFERLLALGPDEGCKCLLLAQPPGVVARRPCPEAATDVDTPADRVRLGRA